MIRNVSLGHGLFDLINKEKQLKVSLDHHLIDVIQNSVFNGITQLIEVYKQKWPISFY